MPLIDIWRTSVKDQFRDDVMEQQLNRIPGSPDFLEEEAEACEYSDDDMLELQFKRICHWPDLDFFDDAEASEDYSYLDDLI